MDLVLEARAEQRSARGALAAPPFDPCFLRARALRPQHLELRGERGVVLVDFLGVDEAEAGSGARVGAPARPERLAQPQLPGIRALGLAHRRGGGAEEAAGRGRVDRVL